MTWTYSATGVTELDKLRRRIGDVVSANPLLTDEEIADFQDEYGDDRYQAAIACVESILAKLAIDTDRSGQGMQSTRSQKTTHFEGVLKRLKDRSSVAAAPFLGGTSISRMDDLDADTDYVAPAFERDRDANA